MITEWLVAVGAGLFAFIADLLPDWEPPTWLANIGGLFEQVWGFADGLAPWVDWSLAGIVAGVLAAVWVFSLTFRAGRALFAHVPFIGGKG